MALSSQNKLKFSIIIVSYNAGEKISETIENVLSQDFDNYEIIVKDGMSKDDTLERIPQNEKIRVYQEPDTGIYDAMNQATRYAKGEYVYFLNCGDLLADPYVLKNVSDAMDDTKAIVYGDFICNHISYSSPKNYNSFKAFYKWICHQSCFFNREFLLKEGGYDCQYRLAADYHFFVKCVVRDKNLFQYIPIPICIYERGGVSEQQKKITFHEQKLARKREYSKVSYFFLSTIEIVCLIRLRRKINGDWVPYKLRKFIIGLLNHIR